MAVGDMVVGLDLGTTKVCVVIAEVTAGDGRRVIGVGHTPSDGLRRGVVVDVQKTVQAISRFTKPSSWRVSTSAQYAPG